MDYGSEGGSNGSSTIISFGVSFNPLKYNLFANKKFLNIRNGKNLKTLKLAS